MKTARVFLTLALCIGMILPGLGAAEGATYMGTAQGFGGDVTAYVTVNEDGRIEAVSVGQKHITGAQAGGKVEG